MRHHHNGRESFGICWLASSWGEGGELGDQKKPGPEGDSPTPQPEPPKSDLKNHSRNNNWGLQRLF